MSLKFTTLPPKSLYQPILSTDTTFKLADITGFDNVDLTAASFGTVGYGVLLNSDRTVMELFSWDPTTIASASISFVARGLPFDGGAVAVTANKLDWAAGSTVLLGADTPQFMQWIKDYIDGIAIAGAPDASTTAKGLVEEATQAEVDAGTAAGGTAARLFINPSSHRARLFNDYAADSVGTDSYAITVNPAITAYTVGMVFTFKAGTANTGAASLAVSGLSAKTIKKNFNEDLVTGDIVAGQICIVEYDSSGNFQLLSNTPTLSPTTTAFTASGTWTKPANLKYVVIELVGAGGGGGGGGGSGGATGGGGGGGGGYSRKVVAAASLGATETVTIGAAGSAGSGDGGAGGTTSFGSHCSATGGAGGIDVDSANTGDGGAGGIGSSGNINSSGQGGGGGGGAASGSGGAGPGGSGGSSFFGGGAAGNGGSGQAGNAGTAYGGGGGGGIGAQSGGAGAAGYVIVTEYY